MKTFLFNGGGRKTSGVSSLSFCMFVFVLLLFLWLTVGSSVELAWDGQCGATLSTAISQKSVGQLRDSSSGGRSVPK